MRGLGLHFLLSFAAGPAIPAGQVFFPTKRSISELAVFFFLICSFQFRACGTFRKQKGKVAARAGAQVLAGDDGEISGGGRLS